MKGEGRKWAVASRRGAWMPRPQRERLPTGSEALGGNKLWAGLAKEPATRQVKDLLQALSGRQNGGSAWQSQGGVL